MAEKPRLKSPVIVEGKYDKIKLESIVDALIIPTDGFRVFKDRKMRAFIRRLADDSPIAVLTDSDAAGFLIRRHLSGILPPDKIVNVYIPDVFGKEKRKDKPSREGKLGVEGIESRALLDALERAGLLEGGGPCCQHPVTRMDLYEAGLSGGPNSRALRMALVSALDLPARLSAGALPQVLSRLLSREEFFSLCSALERDFCGDAKRGE